jgi:predicted amidohydrolase YtcJ
MTSEKTTLYTGGPVLVMHGRPSTDDALVVRNGRIVATGPRIEMEAVAGRGAERVDLAGATLMPGLIDTHPHLLHFGGLTHPLVDLADATCHADIVERLRARAAETPVGQWIMATPVGEPHYFIRRSWRDLAEGALPDRDVLDHATAEHPVFIQAWAPVIPNVCALNGAALAALGIDRETPDRVENVWIDKDGDGRPTGILRGSVNNYYTNDPFMNELMRKVPLFEPEAILAGTRKAVGDYHRLGVTTVYEGHAMGPMEIGVYRMLREQDALDIRVLTSLEAETYGLPWSSPLSMTEFEANLETALEMTERSDPFLRANGVTLSRGGPCWPGFLRMHRPYLGPYGEKTRGVTFVSGEKEEKALAFCAERHLRLNFIGAGDRDHDEFLDRAEPLADRHDLATRHWILQHAYLVTAEQAQRYARLGFDVTTSLSFCWGKGDLLRERIGEHVWADLIPLRRLLEAGMTVACGSDWGPKNVFEQIALAETHEFCASGHRNAGSAQAVTREQALAMWTRDAARVLQWEGLGTLEAGNEADLVVVDRDPSACPLEDLPTTAVLRTVVGGRTVYDGGGLA